MRSRWWVAVEWMFATTLALALTHLVIEIVGAAILGYTLIFLLPVIGGVVAVPLGVFQWLVLRRRFDEPVAWIVFTLLGFTGAWTLTVIVAALLFVPSYGLDGARLYVSLAAPTPIIGWLQSRVSLQWKSHTLLWMIASAIAWSGFFAIEVLRDQPVWGVDQLAGRLVSSIAGYSIASALGTTVIAGAFAGAVTGAALLHILPTEPR